MYMLSQHFQAQNLRNQKTKKQIAKTQMSKVSHQKFWSSQSQNSNSTKTQKVRSWKEFLNFVMEVVLKSKCEMDIEALMFRTIEKHV